MKKINTSDGIVAIISWLFIWMGASALYDDARNAGFDKGTWAFSIGAVIFGSMLIGVAFHKMSQAAKASNVKSTKRKK